MATGNDNPDFHYREGNHTDALCIGALATQVFLDTYATEGIRPDLAREVFTNYSPDAFAVRLADSDTTFIVAEWTGCLTAFCEVVRNRSCPVASVADTIELERLYVQPAFQRYGIGRTLLQRAEWLAAEAGADSLWLTVWTANAGALQFYRALGYDIAGTTAYSFEGGTYENQVLVKNGLIA